jgi:hypothetical protein
LHTAATSIRRATEGLTAAASLNGAGTTARATAVHVRSATNILRPAACCVGCAANTLPSAAHNHRANTTVGAIST